MSSPYGVPRMLINAITKVIVWVTDVTWVWELKYYKTWFCEKNISQVLMKKIKRWFAGFVDSNRGRHWNRKRA